MTTTKTPHHATAALARKLGIALSTEGDVCTATYQSFKYDAPTFKEALALVMASMPKTVKVPKVKKPAAKKVKSKKKDGKKPAKSGVMAYVYYERYRKNDGNCGDALALALKAATTTIDKGKSGKAHRKVFNFQALLGIARENGVDTSPYSKLNPGMARMDISNKLRAMPLVLIQGKKIRMPEKDVD